MPDVGVLNLQIQENSEAAVGGLDKLEGALIKIRDAVNGGLKLAPIANGLEKLGKVVNEQISGSTIVKIGQLADELSKLKGLENVNIRINTGTSVDSIREAVAETRETIGGINDGFDEVGERVAEVNSATETYHDTMNRMYQLMQNTGWTGGYQQFKQMLMEFLKMRSAMALGPGTQISTDVEKGWTDWKNGAIEVEGYVSEVHDKIEGMAEVPKLTSGPIQVFASIEDAARALGITVDEAKRRIQAAIDAAGSSQQSVTVFNTIEEAAQSMGISVDEARRMVGEVVETANTPVDGTAFESIGENSFSASRLVDALIEKIEILEEEVRTGQTEKGTILSEKAIINDRIQIEKLTDQVNRLLDKIRAGQEVGGSSIVDALGDYSKIDLMTMKLDAMRDALANDIEANRLDSQQIANRMLQINNLRDQIESLRQTQDDATRSTFSMRDALAGVRDQISHMGISRLVQQFMRLARMRAMRAIIRQIAAGFREGVENVYNYSKAINSSFAPSMDSAVSSLLQMKNSIGAAAAPLLQSLIPVMQTLVNWFITGINYLNQFLALLRGQGTWTRALTASATAFDKQKKSAKDAGNAIKDLLADWDELNIIQSQSGGGSGGAATAAEDYLKMFEEVGKFDNKIKDTVNFIKDNFGTILSVAEGIGAAILAWKISKAFGNQLGFLQTLELAAGLTLLINGVNVSTAVGYNIGKNGLNSNNLLDAIGGIFQTALGGALVGVAYGGIAGGAIGLLVGTTIGLVSLAVSISNGELDKIYGDIKLTTAEIQEEVNKLFKFDVTAELNNATVDHESIETAKSAVTTALHDAGADYATLKLKLTHDNSAELMSSVSRVIDTTNTLLKQYEKEISVGFGFDVNFSDPKFVQSFSIENLSGLEQHISNLGKRIGDILEDGIVDAVEGPLLEDLMNELTSVTNAIATGKAAGKFAADLERQYYNTDWSNLSRESLIEYANTYTSQKKNLEEAGYLQALDTKSALRGIYAGMVERNQFEPGFYSEDQIRQAWENYANYDMQAAINDYVNKASAEGRDIFVNNMMTAFNSAISNAQMDTTKWGSELKSGSNLEEWLRKNMAVNLGWNEQDFSDVMDAMGISGMDMLTEELRRKYIIAITNALGDTSGTYARLREELSIPIDEIVTVKQAAWSSWGDEQRKNFIANIAKAYGGRETIEALKASGFNLGEIISASMRFSGNTRDSFYNTLTELYGADAIRNAMEKSGIDTAYYDALMKKNAIQGAFAKPGSLAMPTYGAVSPQTGNPDPTTGTQVSADIGNASENVIRALGSLGADVVRELQRLANRPVNVNINPTATFGRGVNASLGTLGKVTGNNP